MPLVASPKRRSRVRSSATVSFAPLRLLHRWHLLSLDAPTVATLWTALIAHAAAVHLPAITLPAMFLAVWVLYAADRLLDAQPLHQAPTITADLELRHLFHHRHRRAFLIAVGLATAALAGLIPQLAAAVLTPFLILGTLLVGYFVLIHATSGSHRLPKELAVGLFFSAAVCIPTAAQLRPAGLRAMVPLALLFAALCCLNCLCIYAWEHPNSPSAPTAAPHRLTETASRSHDPSRQRSPNFDRIARPYRLLETLTLGNALARTRTAHLAALASCRSALVLGDGDGRALAALLRINPHLHAIAVDASSAMLRLLASRCAFARHRLTALHTDALAILGSTSLPAPSFDLVTTHFFLDCFTDSELAILIPAIRAHLAPGALWAVSEFRIPPSGPLRLPARLLVRALYLAFRLLTGLRPTRLPDFAPLLRQAGLRRRGVSHHLGGLLTSELWQLRAIPSDRSR